LEPLLARQADAIVVTVDSHSDRFRASGKPVTVLYNYPLLSSLDFERCSDGRTVLHVGILSTGRGSLTMIEAINLLVRRMDGVRLVLVGAFDSPQDETEVRQLIVQHQLEDIVELVGWVPFSDLPRWFAQADVGLVPWLDADQFPPPIIPTKLFEYMGSRMPVVASERAEIARFMDGLDCGLVVKPGDPHALAEAIEYLLAHPTAAKQMGDRGRRAVEERYHWGSEGEKLLALYRGML
jgi:glycosyltransferase involved in cell wall biosynthesis